MWRTSSGHPADIRHGIGRADFEDALRTALSKLYDPAALRDSRLIVHLGLETRADAARVLRHQLLSAIESLRPDDDVPAQAKSWRYFHILHDRYREQFTQMAVAGDLGLSVRQLRREEKRALGVLADRLWAQHKLASGDADANPARNQSRREEELAWSQTAFPIESVAVKSLVQSALETVRPIIDAQSVSVAYIASPEMPQLSVQLAPMRQALLNILTTALDWLAEGRLEIRAEHPPGGEGLQLSISGFGSISAPLDAETERLQVARQLVAFSDGQVEVVKDGEGDAAFVFRLTLLTDSLVKVLAVDDNPDTLQLLQRYTTGTRYRLLGESDPERSLELAEQTLPDIILLDVLLQDVDGWELLGRFRAHPQLGDRPVIVCTILPQAELALCLGAAGFLSKPLSQRQLLAALDAQVNRLNG